MGQLDSFIEDFKQDGHSDGVGTFSINFSKAREKLAKYQLRNVNESILKFVQAANLGAGSLEVFLDERSAFTLIDTSPEFTLDRVLERLSSPGMNLGHDAVGCLCVGLGALISKMPNGVEITVRRARETSYETARLSEDMDRQQHQGPAPAVSSIEISATPISPTDIEEFTELLATRCSFSVVKITLNGEPLECRLPVTSGVQRKKYFTENVVLAEQFVLPSNTPKDQLPVMLEKFKSASEEWNATRLYTMQLTVDIDPVATVWLTKAGVLLEEKRLDIQVPGIIAVVRADDLDTDLTGSQFIENDLLQTLQPTLAKTGRKLAGEALSCVGELEADGTKTQKRGIQYITTALVYLFIQPIALLFMVSPVMYFGFNEFVVILAVLFSIAFTIKAVIAAQRSSERQALHTITIEAQSALRLALARAKD